MGERALAGAQLRAAVVHVHQEIVGTTMADDFVLAVAGQLFRSLIPIGDVAVDVYEVHAVGQVLEDRLVEVRDKTRLRPVLDAQTGTPFRKKTYPIEQHARREVSFRTILDVRTPLRYFDCNLVLFGSPRPHFLRFSQRNTSLLGPA
jgi:hypothetical protein